MIRQPDFVMIDFAKEALEKTKKKKPHDLLNKVEFETIEEGPCIQMLHTGSYDSEPESFKKMEEFAHAKNLKRISHSHREIYLSDARKVAPEKLRTVLRFQVEKKESSVQLLLRELKLHRDPRSKKTILTELGINKSWAKFRK
jgi:hypothetical protein